MDRDNSYDAILRRYAIANEISIVCSDRYVFNSLRDVHYMVKKCQELEERIKELENKNNG